MDELNATLASVMEYKNRQVGGEGRKGEREGSLHQNHQFCGGWATRCFVVCIRLLHIGRSGYVKVAVWVVKDPQQANPTPLYHDTQQIEGELVSLAFLTPTFEPPPPDPSPQVEVEEEILHLKEENQELKEKLDQQRVDLER